MADSNTTNSIYERAINLIIQQRELYGDFEIVKPAIKPIDLHHNEAADTNIETEPASEAVVQEEKVLSLSEQIEQCPSLSSLNELISSFMAKQPENDAMNMVLGSGNQSSKLMIIGHQASDEDIKAGYPVAGPAGDLFDKILTAIQFNRSDLYITHFIKQAAVNDSDPGDATHQHYLHFLKREIELINPPLILCLGDEVANAIMGQQFNLEQLRSVFYNYQGRQILVTYAPEALLHDQTRKRPTWEDVQLLRKQFDKVN